MTRVILCDLTNGTEVQLPSVQWHLAVLALIGKHTLATESIMNGRGWQEVTYKVRDTADSTSYRLRVTHSRH